MKYLSYYQKKGITEEGAFDYFTSTMRPSIAGWDYFIDWNKVRRQAEKLQDELNLLNGLIGSANLKDDFIAKIKKYPSIALTFPVLLAIRDETVEVSELLDGKLTTKSFKFHKDAEESIAEDYWDFFDRSGLAALFKDRKIKNVSDYVFGVEVGLDTNGRKNRGGATMEKIVDEIIAGYCKKYKLEYLKEANADKIKQKFGYDVPVDKSSRRYDFVIDLGTEPLLVEANFYGGGGSKLKSTAGEYRNLFDVLDGKFKFVWITDGAGWKKTLRPLRETFDHNEYVFNLFLLEDGILEDVR
jgi:type II restriction enzyme